MIGRQYFQPTYILPTLTPMRVLMVAFCIAASAVIAPLWVPLVLAAWATDILGSPVRRLECLLGGRRRAATAVVVILVVGVLIPIIGVVAAVASGMGDLFDQVRAALKGHGSLASALLGQGVIGRPEAGDWANLASRHGANAWHALSMIARASASATIGLLVFVAALYTFTVDGEQIRAWLEEHAPVPRAAFARLVGAFYETGRGLIVAGGGTAVVQGAVATLAYVAIGIPQALLLGPLTAICALVPFIGTGLVWIPIAIELIAAGHYWRAGVVIGVGAVIHSLIDNFVRPMLARYGRLMLPTFLVLVSMLGGLAAFGATGALLGPLLVRLCVEALAIISDEGKISVSAQAKAGRGDDECPGGPETVE